MQLLDTLLTYAIETEGRREICRLRLYSHAGKIVAVISDMPKREVNQIYDDATSLYEAITRQWGIRLTEYSQVLHFAPIEEADVPERFGLFFPGVSVGTGEPGSVQIAGRMVPLDRTALENLIGEGWED